MKRNFSKLQNVIKIDNAPIFHYNSWTFKLHPYCGPWPIKVDGEPRKFAGPNFFQDIQPLLDMLPNDRKEYLVNK